MSSSLLGFEGPVPSASHEDVGFRGHNASRGQVPPQFQSCWSSEPAVKELRCQVADDTCNGMPHRPAIETSSKFWDHNARNFTPPIGSSAVTHANLLDQNISPVSELQVTSSFNYGLLNAILIG